MSENLVIKKSHGLNVSEGDEEMNVTPEKKCIDKSNEYFARAKEIIPAYTQTIAKGPGQYVKGVAPKYLASGKGSHVWDVDGNEYIDYSMGVGPLILGYNYPAVNEAIEKQLKSGTTFSLMHPLEVELAEMIVDIIPCAEAVRYGKNGADVTSAAVRVARAFTKREYIACCGYHGWHDWYASLTGRGAGIPECIKALTLSFKYNDIHTLEKLFEDYKDKIACVIMEPATIEEPRPGFLEQVKDLVHKNDAVLIFDEIWTGFRFALGGFQELCKVTPDLATFSKAMSNGMPISAIVGKKEIMRLFDKEVFFFITMGGECLSLAAAIATINEIKEKRVIDYIWKQGRKVQDGFNKIVSDLGIQEYTNCIGYPCRSVFNFFEKEGLNSLEMKSLVQQELIKRGILWSGFGTMSFSHSDDDIKYTLEAFAGALEVLKKAIKEKSIRKYLEGESVEPALRPLKDFHLKRVRK